MSRYFVDEGVSTYTYVSDQLSTYGTKVIVVTEPEATSVLDEILGNQTDLPIAEHATDTAGATLVNFALFDLVDLLFSPRIRDLGKITLCRAGTKAEALARYPRVGPLLSRRANQALIADQWTTCCAWPPRSSSGTPPTRWWWASCPRRAPEHAGGSAEEYGLVRRTIYAARYLSDPANRRRITRQLSKGEKVPLPRRRRRRSGHARVISGCPRSARHTLSSSWTQLAVLDASRVGPAWNPRSGCGARPRMPRAQPNWAPERARGVEGTQSPSAEIWLPTQQPVDHPEGVDQPLRAGRWCFHPVLVGGACTPRGSAGTTSQPFAYPGRDSGALCSRRVVVTPRRMGAHSGEIFGVVRVSGPGNDPADDVDALGSHDDAGHGRLLRRPPGSPTAGGHLGAADLRRRGRDVLAPRHLPGGAGTRHQPRVPLVPGLDSRVRRPNPRHLLPDPFCRPADPGR